MNEFKKGLIKLYLTWFNDWTSVPSFADYYGLDLYDAHALIKLGRQYNEELATANKFRRQREEQEKKMLLEKIKGTKC